MVVQVARTIPRIYAMLEDHQGDHQSTVAKAEGNIDEKYSSFLLTLDLLTVISLLDLLIFLL